MEGSRKEECREVEDEETRFISKEPDASRPLFRAFSRSREATSEGRRIGRLARRGRGKEAPPRTWNGAIGKGSSVGSSNLVGGVTADSTSRGSGGGPRVDAQQPPPPPGSPPSSSSLLERSVGGAVNNVATRKINCVQAAGLGGAFGGPAEAPGL